MIIQPSSILDQQLTIDSEITIIGSGAGGARTAAFLTEKGYKVVLIEEGPYVSQKDFDQDGQKLVPKMYRRSAGLATDDMSMRILQGRVFGGSTTINWMTSLRTPDFVLEQWERQFGLSAYSPDMMKKHFDSVEERLSVHQIPVSDHSAQNRIIMDGAEKLGINWFSSYNNSKGCIGCGTCGLGCPYNAKQDMRLTYLRDAIKKGLIVYTSARAEKIKYYGKDSQITQVTILGEEFGEKNKTLKVTSRRTVVAAGAIYTPLILQKSGLTKGGLVGKFLHVHPVTGTFAKFDRDINPTYGTPQTVVSKEYQNLDGKGYGFWLEVPDLEPFLMAVNFPGYGVERRNALREMQKYGVIIVLVRDGANKNSEVSNGQVRWRRGFNKQNGSFNAKKIPSIRYNLSNQDKHHLLKGLENAIEIHFAAGAKTVFTLHNKGIHMNDPSMAKMVHKWPNGPNELSLFSAHPTGTARMGADPKKSVVNQMGQMHHYPGVFVLDGSILPTAPGVNPMITILGTISNALELGGLGLE